MTSRLVKNDDTADVLDVKKWRFDVTPPDPRAGVEFHLEVRRKGQPPQPLAGFATGSPAPTRAPSTWHTLTTSSSHSP